MFVKSLTILSDLGIIRDITFRKGINLIVDESSNQITGNSVGKTTVLKLIDFCLGADPKDIYVDPESKRDEYILVKEFLIKNNVLIRLVLTENLDNENTNRIVIERNFLFRNNIIRRINNENYSEVEFEKKLSSLVFPNHLADKPTFRQIISHNIRYKDESINNTLKTLDKYTSDAEYETLYLFLFGCDFDKGNSKQEILLKLRQEENYKNRLENRQTRTAYETALTIVNNEIDELKKKKANLNLNENYEADLDKLNEIKYKINRTSAEISKMNIRIDIIHQTELELKSDVSEIDVNQLRMIYLQANSFLGEMQKSFEDLVNYHNYMIKEKIKFISKELPELEKNIKHKSRYLNNLLSEEIKLSAHIAKTDTYEELEKIVEELNNKYRLKGEYDNVIQQLFDVEKNIRKYSQELNKIDNELFSDDFEKLVKVQLAKFNKHFSEISSTLYDEKYAIKHDIIVNKKKQRLYKFTAFNANLSSGKKQGEISCFDIAYTLFADEENIPCLHFLLNDKKELMHDNQLLKIATLVNENNIQFIASILKDKLPQELDNEEYFVIKLSQKDKLFRLEN